MIIAAVGDSFIYGSELQDCEQKKLQAGYSRKTFTALAAEALGAKYTTNAYPGIGNDSIRRRTIDLCETARRENKLHELFVIVSWTFPYRFEFRFPYRTMHSETPWYTIGPWTNLETPESVMTNVDQSVIDLHLREIEYNKSVGLFDFVDSFLKNVGEDQWVAYHSLQSMVAVKDYLENRKIPYLFTSGSDDWIKHARAVPSNKSLQNLIELAEFDDWFWFPGSTGFLRWARENGYPYGSTHPLEEAHAAAAVLIKEKISEVLQRHESTQS